VSSNPLGSPPDISSHKKEYEKFYSGTDDWCQRDVQSPWYSFVRSHLPVLENRSVLEIACGRGALSCYMSELGADVYAVDIAEEALRIGSRRAKERKLDTRFIGGSFYDIPFPGSFFDVVVSCETIEHLVHPKMGLIEIRRVIKPGGRLYLTTENYLNLVGLYRLTLWLRGKSFDSGSGIQPIEQPFIYFHVLRLLKSIGFRVILTNASTHQVWIPKGGIHDIEFVERVRVLRRLLKYFGRHVYFVAEAEK
jgi:2-polyprenyl-3-methyl-5-hydroxy-6-metoxy-1,4-benzoquinol methylase